MKILALQHGEFDHPGVFRHLLAEDGHDLVSVHLYAGETPPPLDGFDGLIVGGGIMDVWEKDIHPWLAAEKALIREAVAERGLPYLGLCLGHQLLACALDGAVGKAARPEVGVKIVQMTEEGAVSLFLDDVPEEFPCLQWHGAEITRLPEGAKVLATSPACAVQAMSWGPRAFSTQFHLEADAETAANWTADRVARDTLDIHLGPGGADRLIADCAAHMERFNTNAERIYINWLQAGARV
ncbi:MAG TPA: type 1 glutamine amidotransferase [Thermohalobaculum sp.]|nr:type 1 glutamine amidotransferase [Thermohalobaculum sp.]